MKQARQLALAAALMSSLLLGACSSDDPVAEPPLAQEPTEIPVSATASTQALVDWAAAQPASETLEPLDITKATPPLSDSDEPASLH